MDLRNVFWKARFQTVDPKRPVNGNLSMPVRMQRKAIPTQVYGIIGFKKIFRWPFPHLHRRAKPFVISPGQRNIIPVVQETQMFKRYSHLIAQDTKIES